ncbi:MAG TPA: hypothetical protein VLA46_02295 [Saprospiraceae bacterium]|nr:hypothetical protein [Saprospiraceae bacterium]
MARRHLLIPILALIACLLVRDVVACLNYIPGYFVFAEILEEECSNKSEKEGKKEMDESKIHLYLSTPADMLVVTPSIAIRDGLKNTSLPFEILYPPPNQA